MQSISLPNASPGELLQRARSQLGQPISLEKRGRILNELVKHLGTTGRGWTYRAQRELCALLGEIGPEVVRASLREVLDGLK